MVKRTVLISFLKGLGIAGMIAAIIYVAGVIAFESRFPFRYSMDGESILFESVVELSLDKMYETQFMSLKIRLKDGSIRTIPFSKLGIHRKTDAEIASLLPPSWKWPASLFTDHEYRSGDTLSYSVDKIRQVVLFLDCFTSPDIVDATDAYMVRTDDGFEIVPETNGSRLDSDKAVDCVLDCILDGTFEADFKDARCYVIADVTKDDPDLIKRVEHGNALLTQRLCVEVRGERTTMPQKIVADSISYVSGDTFSADRDVYAAFAHKIYEKYTTDGKPRKFMSSMDGEIELEPSGRDVIGGDLFDEQSLFTELYAAATKGEDAVIKGKFLKEESIGPTYLEISLTHQHLWLYVDGELVIDTDVTTGMETPERRTPKAVLRVLEMHTEYTMYGSYGSAFCHYFILLTPDGIAVHDAAWREIYGGDEYIRNGSHGCINTPFEAEEKIFKTLEAMDDWHIPAVIY